MLICDKIDYNVYKDALEANSPLVRANCWEWYTSGVRVGTPALTSRGFGASEFDRVAEHEYGIYAKTVKNNPDIPEADKQYIFDQLKANFNGECSEVGMYLCMARIAHREGYPEIGLYWEKAAYEEAEHAAKFAEMLGEDLEPNMKATTKDNLKWRVDCEFGATQGKFDLAKCAKKNNLDAIHDTVHEMAKDEARHGRALKGLLDRYFK